MSARFIGLILVVGFVALVLNLTGFCYLQFRYVLNRELFENAIAYQKGKMGDYASADSPSSYLMKHPNCCSIPDFQPTNSALNVLLGYRIRYVRVVYRRPQDEINQSPGVGEFYEAFVAITPCGTPLHAIGTAQTEMN